MFVQNHTDLPAQDRRSEGQDCRLHRDHLRVSEYYRRITFRFGGSFAGHGEL